MDSPSTSVGRRATRRSRSLVWAQSHFQTSRQAIYFELYLAHSEDSGRGIPREKRECNTTGPYFPRTTQTILRFLKVGYNAIEITGCWANINASGASHAIHSHPNNFLSGIYYVHTHPGADSVSFHDPRLQAGIIRPPVTELTSQNTDQVAVTVSDGMLLMFPSYLAHSVAPNESDKLRISISFNMMFSLYSERLSRPLWGSTADTHTPPGE